MYSLPLLLHFHFLQNKYCWNKTICRYSKSLIVREENNFCFNNQHLVKNQRDFDITGRIIARTVHRVQVRLTEQPRELIIDVKLGEACMSSFWVSFGRDITRFLCMFRVIQTKHLIVIIPRVSLNYCGIFLNVRKCRKMSGCNFVGNAVCVSYYGFDFLSARLSIEMH